MSFVAASVRALSTDGTAPSIESARFHPSLSENAMYQCTVSALRGSLLRMRTSTSGRSTET